MDLLPHIITQLYDLSKCRGSKKGSSAESVGKIALVRQIPRQDAKHAKGVVGHDSRIESGFRDIVCPGSRQAAKHAKGMVVHDSGRDW